MKRLKLEKYRNLFFAATIGNIEPPAAIAPLSGGDTGTPAGLFNFIGIAIKLLIFGAGIFTLFNLIFAGFGFISAGGNSDQIEAAWAKIWQSLLGLVIVASSFILAGLIGQIIFKDTSFLLVPRLYRPQ
ncbi:MAG: hypothetical protein ABIB61_04510 [Candidatus Shapirobacteria bacterium]